LFDTNIVALFISLSCVDLFSLSKRDITDPWWKVNEMFALFQQLWLARRSTKYIHAWKTSSGVTRAQSYGYQHVILSEFLDDIPVDRRRLLVLD